MSEFDESKRTDILEQTGTPGDLAGCVLYIAEGAAEDVGRSIVLRAGIAKIGSDAQCELQLHDSAVSRQHAELEVTPEGVHLRDVGSTNGTFYLGNRIVRALLRVGTHLTLGKTTLAILPLPNGKGVEPDVSTHYGELRGVSLGMRRLFATLRRLEESDAPVLILGETGTGKEVVARTIHDQGRRKERPFIVVDCGAIARDLVDSELFGHARGAFTGATSDHAGAFEAAHGGTLFLDEIGELPLDLQPRLLRALEAKQVRRVGETSFRDVDVRIIAATHRDLREALTRGTFREDLYYRLAVVRLSLPPLRERLEDLDILAQQLLQKLAGAAAFSIPDDVLRLMRHHDWPGNVRELRNVLHRLVSLGDLSEEVSSVAPRPSASAPAVDLDAPYKEARERVVQGFEAAYVRAVLERCGGNISQAARSAGIERHYLKALMRKHGLYEPQGGGGDGE